MVDFISAIVANPYLFISLLIIWFIALSWFIIRLFNFLIRFIFSRTTTKADDKIVRIIRNIFLLGLAVTAVYIITLYSSSLIQWHDAVEKGYTAIMILLLSYLLAEIIAVLLVEIHYRSYKKTGQKIHSAVPFMSNFAKIGLFALAAIIIMRLYQIDVTPAIASAGVAGVALAFAAKDFVANLFGGVSVFFDKPYTIGDYVILQGQHRGEVMDIGMRSTKIKTRDSVLLTVPNSVMVTDVVVNETGYETHLRVRIPIEVSYDSDLEKVEKVLNDVAKKHEKVLENPAPRVRYREFKESGIGLELLIEIPEPSKRGHITHDIIKMVHKRFLKENIHIPYPKRDIYMHKA